MDVMDVQEVGALTPNRLSSRDPMFVSLETRCLQFDITHRIKCNYNDMPCSKII